MKTFSTLLLLMLAFYSQPQQDNAQTERSAMDAILGEWTAINQTMRRDGSGQYDLDSALYIKAFKILGGHGHQVDWFNTKGDYYGSTLRIYSSTEGLWISKWFDPQQGIWMDEVKFEQQNGKLVLETKVKDETGEYEIKREHLFSKDGQRYNYHHYRKYPGMTRWLLVDHFEAKRVK